MRKELGLTVLVVLAAGRDQGQLDVDREANFGDRLGAPHFDLRFGRRFVEYVDHGDRRSTTTNGTHYCRRTARGAPGRTTPSIGLSSIANDDGGVGRDGDRSPGTAAIALNVARLHPGREHQV